MSKRIELFERTTGNTSMRVDRAAGVIRGVRILGPVSANKRRYTARAIQDGAKLYEGKQVNFDHPGVTRQDRTVADRAGWLEGVQVRDGGLTGDLHLLKADPRTDKILEAAERRPALFGLSHNAQGSVRHDGDAMVVETIESVRSVDIVADPATTRSLFESDETGSSGSQGGRVAALSKAAALGDRFIGQPPTDRFSRLRGFWCDVRPKTTYHSRPGDTTIPAGGPICFP